MLSSIKKHQQATLIGLRKNINKFMRLASVRFERVDSFNRPRNLARPLAGIEKNKAGRETKTMKYIGLLFLIFGMTFSGCNQKRKTTTTENELEKIETLGKPIDKKEIRELIRTLYKWEDKNSITIGQTALIDENEEKVIGFDTIKNLEFIEEFRKTKLFSEEFLSNYQKVVKTLDKKIKSKEIEWLAGDMPPYGNGSNPWCNCQDEPYAEYWNKIEITFIEINQFDATLTWTWGESDWSKNFNYKVKVKKENEKWKVSYLQGFDFDKMTKRNY